MAVSSPHGTECHSAGLPLLFPFRSAAYSIRTSNAHGCLYGPELLLGGSALRVLSILGFALRTLAPNKLLSTPDSS
jgi:hypothetical protein